MKRYKFLLLAFFLATSVYALGPMVAKVNDSIPDMRQNSSRNAWELGNISESTQNANQPVNNNPLNNNINPNRTPNTSSETKTSSLSTVSCKTYEGKIYDQGEAGYNDCIRSIRNDRQGTRSVP